MRRDGWRHEERWLERRDTVHFSTHHSHHSYTTHYSRMALSRWRSCGVEELLRIGISSSESWRSCLIGRESVDRSHARLGAWVVALGHEFQQ